MGFSYLGGAGFAVPFRRLKPPQYLFTRTGGPRLSSDNQFWTSGMSPAFLHNPATIIELPVQACARRRGMECLLFPAAAFLGRRRQSRSWIRCRSLAGAERPSVPIFTMLMNDLLVEGEMSWLAGRLRELDADVAVLLPLKRVAIGKTSAKKRRCRSI